MFHGRKNSVSLPFLSLTTSSGEKLCVLSVNDLPPAAYKAVNFIQWTTGLRYPVLSRPDILSAIININIFLFQFGFPEKRLQRSSQTPWSSCTRHGPTIMIDMH